LWNDEGDCAQTLSGLTLVPLAPGRATVSLAEIQTAAAGAPGMRVAVPVGAISIETPVRRVAGQAFDPKELAAISGFARERGIGLHLDGARLLLEALPRRVRRSVRSRRRSGQGIVWRQLATRLA
jgi:threonine aldolase